MSLLRRLKPVPMKSLYYGVVLAMVVTLSLSFLVFRGISDRMEKKSIDPVYDRFDELQLESARGALGSGGAQALNIYLTKLDRIFAGSSHYLLDANGIAETQHVAVDRGKLVADVGAGSLRHVGGLLPHGLHHGHERRHPMMDGEVDFLIVGRRVFITFDEQEHLFERFYRAPTAASLHVQGIGLGLLVVKKIVDAHGGHVSVRSEPGSGATFRMMLPLDPTVRRSTPSAVPALARSSAR